MSMRDGARSKKLKRIELDLWDSLDNCKTLLHSEDFEKTKADMHYLNGKVEGLEKALMTFYNMEDADEIYERRPEN